MLEKEFNYYLEHQEDLVKEYNGRVLVIVGDCVVGSYENHEKAFFDSLSKYEPGTFLIQKCSPGTKDYTQRILLHRRNNRLAKEHRQHG